MTNIQKTVKKRGFRGVGTFLFGMLFGLIFTLAILFGVGYWAYKNLSINKIESITKKEIDIGNESIKNLTISDVVKNVSGVVSNLDTYTIAKLENDFDIVVIGEGGFVPESLYGLDLTPLKNSTKNSLKDDINKVIGNASLNTFINYLKKTDAQLGMFATIIDTEVVYYYDTITEKLYLEQTFTTEVSFDYDKVDNTIELNNTTYDIKNGKVAIPFRQIPIEQAFSNFDAVTENLKVYKILGYTESNGKFYTDSSKNEEVTGIMATLANKNVSDLNSEFINDTEVGELLSLYLNPTDNSYYKTYDSTTGNYSNKVTGVLATISKKTVEELSKDETYNNFYIYQVMDYTRTGSEGSYIYSDANGEVKGILGAIAGSQLKTLSSDIQKISLSQILNLSSPTGVLKALQSSTIETLENDIKELTLGNALDVDYDSSTGIIRALHGTPISTLTSKINDLKLYQVMNYTRTGSEGNYIYTHSDGVTPITNKVLLALAESDINTIDKSIEGLLAKDIFDVNDPILALFSEEELSTLTITTLPDKLVTKINSSSIYKLAVAGLIDIAPEDVPDIIKNDTIIDVIESFNIAS